LARSPKEQDDDEPEDIEEGTEQPAVESTDDGFTDIAESDDE